jgi:hypothetical protein
MMLPSRLWALAAPGILTQLNAHDHALLGGASPSPEAAQDRAAVLQRDWDAPDRTGLLKSLEWLAREGHRREFNDVCMLDQEIAARLDPGDAIETAVDDKELVARIHFTRRHRERVGTRSLLAWDMVRLITIAGWGYLAGMIREEEAWSYIIPAAQAIQRSYASWDELGKHHLLGREFWSGGWEGRFARCYLALFDDPASPWRTLPWNTDLSQYGLGTPLQTIVVEPPPPPRVVAKKPVGPPEAGDEHLAPAADQAGNGGGPGLVGLVVVAVIVLAVVGAGLVFGARLLPHGAQQAGAAPPTTAPTGAVTVAPTTATTAPAPRGTVTGATSPTASPRAAPQPAAKPVKKR